MMEHFQHYEKKSFARRNPILMQYIRGVSCCISACAFVSLVVFAATLNTDEEQAIRKNKKSYDKMSKQKESLEKQINDSVVVWKQNQK
jgi:uncharacterized protein YoxC